ncbi:MAG: tRNA-dihydrouridine synthase family protein [Bdellovibrionota bacterium]
MLPYPSLSVAPMEGFTTFPMRLFLTMTSQPMAMTTPFLKVTRAFPEDEIPWDFAPELYELAGSFSHSIVPQFIAGEWECFLRATDLIGPEISPFIELNCGCPSPNSMGKLAGSGILQDPDLFARTLETLISRMGGERLAIKMRIGVLSETEFPRLLDSIRDLRFARLTIHGRTRKAGYRGQSSWDCVESAAIAFQSRIPVHASGDVLSLPTLKRLGEVAPHAGGVMIGRGVLRNPWIFEELRTGKSVVLSPRVFISALYCYLLIQELWQNQAAKLFSRIRCGRIGGYCGNDAAAWEKQAVELSGLALGYPSPYRRDMDLKVSPIAFDRLKILWTYLRSTLPEDLRLGPVSKAANAKDFFLALSAALEDQGEFLPLEIM